MSFSWLFLFISFSFPTQFVFLPSSLLPAYFPFCYLLHFPQVFAIWKGQFFFYWWNQMPLQDCSTNFTSVFWKNMNINIYSHWIINIRRASSRQYIFNYAFMTGRYIWLIFIYFTAESLSKYKVEEFRTGYSPHSFILITRHKFYITQQRCFSFCFFMILSTRY